MRIGKIIISATVLACTSALDVTKGRGGNKIPINEPNETPTQDCSAHSENATELSPMDFD